jgi:pimeloyl-ACP methyl ester carboxylesterase
MPGQDLSPDKTVGFGPKEAQVLLDAARWAKGRYKEPPKVVVVGLSLGGGSAWLASELAPDEVDAVVTDAGFARFNDAMQQFFEANARGSSVYLRPVVWIAMARSGLEPGEVLPERAAEKWRGRPALAIHGQADRLFPPRFSEQLAEAAGCDLWLVPNAGHPDCYWTAPEEYARRLTELPPRGTAMGSIR